MARNRKRRGEGLPVIDLTSMSLKTRNVFVDTPVFFNLNFNFKSAALESLAELGACGKAKVLLTKITEGEVEKQVAEAVRMAHAATSNARGEAKILSNIEGTQFKGLFDRWNQEKVLDEIRGQLKSFQKEAKVTMIPVNNVSVDKVFAKYFSSKPPFGTTADKKHEFPDAFVLAGLRDWCKDSDSMTCVISTDKGVCCSPNGPLIALTSLAQFLELLQQHARGEPRLAEISSSALPGSDRQSSRSACDSWLRA